MSHADRTEVFAAMCWADLNVLPSFREGYPKVLLEGMSGGVLSVASDTPMSRSMTEDCGWVFDPRDASTLAGVLATAHAMSAEEWQSRRDAATAYARAHTMEVFSREIDHIVHRMWGYGIGDPRSLETS